MAQEHNRIQLPLEEIKLAFAASCVEGTARKLGVSYIEIFDRMRKVLKNKNLQLHSWGLFREYQGIIPGLINLLTQKL